MGTDVLCAVKTDNTIACYVHQGQAGCNDTTEDCMWFTPPEGRFTSVSAGLCSACGIKVDGTLACWGIVSAAELDVRDAGRNGPNAA